MSRPTGRPTRVGRPVGEASGLEASACGKPEPLRGKLVKLAERGLPRKLPDGRFTAGL